MSTEGSDCMHFFVTGHTGFKGAWLTLLLRELGHSVSGYALTPAKGSLFELAELESELKEHTIADIRDQTALRDAIASAKPDVAIHLAAQPLVLRSYEDPVETLTTNVDGTRNFLLAIREAPAPPTSLVVTTDKVYRDDGKGSYKESDPLGGHDPYSASKAMADIMTQSWAATHPELRLFTARAGNVIGAFDVSENRLIPDAVRAFKSNTRLAVRNPSAVRPWQHVLDCLNGYLMFIAKSNTAPKVLNFGPSPNSFQTVQSVVDQIGLVLPGMDFEINSLSNTPVETSLLTLDSSFAQSSLNWKNKLDFKESLAWSLAELTQGSTPAREIVTRQIREFINR
ncbi:MAG: CDP-glucose 4,6-dehydratase [Actinomycetota bacterium]